MAYPSGKELCLDCLKRGGKSWEVKPQAFQLNLLLLIWSELWASNWCKKQHQFLQGSWGVAAASSNWLSSFVIFQSRLRPRLSLPSKLENSLLPSVFFFLSVKENALVLELMENYDKWKKKHPIWGWQDWWAGIFSWSLKDLASVQGQCIDITSVPGCVNL